MKSFIGSFPGVLPLWRSRPMRAIRASAFHQYDQTLRLYGPKWRALKHRKTLRIMITGTKGKTTTTTMVAQVMAEAGYRVGYCNTEGIVIEGKVVERGDYSSFAGAKRVLTTRSVNCAILETARGDLKRKGLYAGTCHAAALLNIGWDHVGQNGIESREAMLAHKKQVTDASSGRVVLNAEDALVAPLVEVYGVERTTLFALDPAAVMEHRARGGEAVTLTEGPDPRIVHCGPKGEVEIMALADIPASMNGRVPFVVANALAATSGPLGRRGAAHYRRCTQTF